MSTENPANSAEDPASADSSRADGANATRKSRSLAERLVIWGLIGFLVVLAGSEVLARYGYSKTLAAFEAAIAKREEQPYDETNRMSLKEFQDDILQGFASETRNKPGLDWQDVTYKWRSLFHEYELNLFVTPDDDALVMAYSTSNGLIANISAGRSEPDTADGGEPPDPAMLGGPGGPGAGGPGGPDGGRGGRGRGRGQRGLLGLLARDSVQSELKLTEAQKTELQELSESSDSGRESLQQLRDLPPEERAKLLEDRRKQTEAKVRGILDETQFARARQLELHSRGAEALSRDDVAADLGLTEEQQNEITGIFATMQQERRAVFQQVQSGEIERGSIRAKMTELRETAQEQALALLSEQQRQAWTELLGPPPPESNRRRRPRGE